MLFSLLIFQSQGDLLDTSGVGGGDLSNYSTATSSSSSYCAGGRSMAAVAAAIARAEAAAAAAAAAAADNGEAAEKHSVRKFGRTVNFGSKQNLHVEHLSNLQIGSTSTRDLFPCSN